MLLAGTPRAGTHAVDVGALAADADALCAALPAGHPAIGALRWAAGGPLPPPSAPVVTDGVGRLWLATPAQAAELARVVARLRRLERRRQRRRG